MYKKYVKANGEVISPSKLVQVLKDNSIADLPLLRKGITFKEPITSNYKLGKSNNSVKIDGNKIITTISNVVYLSKYENGVFTILKEFEIESASDSDVINYSKVELITNNKAIIGYAHNGTISCFIWHIDESKGIDTKSETFIILPSNSRSEFDFAVLSENKIAVSFIYILRTSTNIMGKCIPRVTTLIIEDNKITMPFLPMDIENFNKVAPTEGNNVFTTKISSNEFLVTYTLRSDRYDTVYSTVFRVDSQNSTHEHETLTFKGAKGNWKIETVKPIYLADNKVITFEVSNYRFNVILRNIDEVNGIYSFNSLSTINISPYTPYIASLLREKTDGSRDFIVFNREVFNVNADNSKLTFIETIMNVNNSSGSYLNSTLEKLIRIENELLLGFDTNNNFQLIKYDNSSGLPLGILKPKGVK